ncbi:hypothetical protein DYB32_009851 [Aphanomyces invadans]|uniref:Uncharacterized protein n=1 Tax=Aphanomyces invadans TaxID=157072 RepID=A0A418AHD1_9STRA|nr:hypothetical protein DYB32_009851 [Aphanomyces invadans]
MDRFTVVERINRPNPIENLWEYLVQRVLGGGMQYSSKEELKSAILLLWTSLDITYLQKLVSSENEKPRGSYRQRNDDKVLEDKL